MTEYTFPVTIEADTLEEAQQVLGARLAHDEDLGFAYTIGYSSDPLVDAADERPARLVVTLPLWPADQHPEPEYVLTGKDVARALHELGLEVALQYGDDALDNDRGETLDVDELAYPGMTAIIE